SNGNNPQPGLTGNPGKEAAVFSDDHPYFPHDCNNCPFYKFGVKAKYGQQLMARVKDCHNCPYIDNSLEIIRGDNHNFKQPPAIETYQKVPNKEIYISPFHGGDELQENRRIAIFIFDKLGDVIYLLPRIDSNTHAEISARKTLLPGGILENKNPDILMWNKFFDIKSMAGVEYDGDWKKSKRKIENRFKSAKKQADNFIIEINDSFPRDLIHQTATNYLNTTKTKRVIMFIWRKKLLIYNN
ncbi:MAG: hypothetical protein J5784_03905, partial [Muribaculaceae bacterium]|nr:hypothetical protein [Muribaculaceae bacterium]